MGWGHDLESVLATARGLRHKQNQLHFLLIGEGPKWYWLRDELTRQAERHVTLLPWVDEAELRYSLTCADLAIVSLEPELSRLAVPSKAYYFLAAGVPLIAICQQDTELADLVHEFQCGIVVPPNHPDLLQSSILKAVNAPSQLLQWRHGAERAARKFDRLPQVERLIKLLDQYVPPRRQAPVT
jgi:glycosyltransferase involved in cell wall biosynthesis